MLTGCRRAEPSGAGLVAVVPFENLTGNADFDAPVRALSALVVARAQGDRQRHAVEISALASAVDLDATHLLQARVTRAGDQFRLHWDWRDQNTGRHLSSGVATDGTFLRLADRVAGALKLDLRPGLVRNAVVLVHFGRGLAADNADLRRTAWTAAIAADPSFPLTYVAWARAFREAPSPLPNLPAIEKAELDVALGVPGSLDRLAALKPADRTTWTALAQARQRSGDRAGAAKAWQTASNLAPHDTTLLNNWAYAEAYRGDLPAAERVLARYREMAPKDANALDSLGEIQVLRGRFAEASSSFLKAHEMDARFLDGQPLWKAAYCRLMEGDRARADELHGRFLLTHLAPRSPARAVWQARWLHLTGRQREAVAMLTPLVANTKLPPEVRVSGAQALVWMHLAANEPDQAAAIAGDILAKLPPEQGAAYRSLLEGRPEEGAKAWAAVKERQNDPTGGAAHQFLAWSLVSAGAFDTARKLDDVFLVPQPALDQPFPSLAFVAQFAWRAKLAAQDGRSADAQRWRRLWQLYRGDRPGPFASVS